MFSNAFSFKEKQIISFAPEPLKEFEEHLFYNPKYSTEEKLLKSLVIYGHNSHGKSNILKAFDFFILFIKSSFTQPKQVIPIEQFALNTSVLNEPSSFEIVFLIGDTKYRYGFEVTTSMVISESLYYAPFGKKESYLFSRVGQEFRVNRAWSKEEDINIELQSVPFAKKNVLLLSVLSAQDSLRIKEISHLLNSIILIRDLNNNNNLLTTATTFFSSPEYSTLIQKFIEGGDLGFSTIYDKIERKISEGSQYERGFLHLLYSERIKRFELYTKHDIYDKTLKQVDTIEFEMLKRESDGTIKFFIVVCFLVFAIKHKCFILIDELDSRFHSDLLNFLISSFHDPIQNNSGSQLLFTSHNTILLDKRLRRDQILLVEKDEFGESTVVKMHTKEKPIRIDASIEKDYRKGKLGGVSRKIKTNPGQGMLFD